MNRKHRNQTEEPTVTLPNHGASRDGLWLSMAPAFRKQKTQKEPEKKSLNNQRDTEVALIKLGLSSPEARALRGCG